MAGFTGGTRKIPGVRQQVARPQKLGPEHNTWYWNPFRADARFAPEDFRKKLREVDPDGLIEVVWNPIRECWGIFYRNPKISHPICSGWVLLFLADPRELDERVLARLYSASAAKWGNGKQYFAAIEREYEREQERKDKLRRDEAVDMAMPFWEHSRISTAGKGNKFSEYHS
jgi:hypothetical protein